VLHNDAALLLLRYTRVARLLKQHLSATCFEPGVEDSSALMGG
jgi:hypothetical protein